MSDALVGDEEFRKRFELAKARCLVGHGAGCFYGGLAPSAGRWLSVAGCLWDHGDACAACGCDGAAVFQGWHAGVSPMERGTVSGLIWGVTLCAACRDREMARNPEWRVSAT